MRNSAETRGRLCENADRRPEVGRPVQVDWRRRIEMLRMKRGGEGESGENGRCEWERAESGVQGSAPGRECDNGGG